MLFILVVDVLNAIVQKANDMVLLQPLTRHPLQHRVSLYTDDMVMFLHPVATDIDLVMDILWVFGADTGLKTNIQKSSVTPNSLHHRGIGFCTTADPVRDSRVSLQISCFTFIGQEADESPNPAYH